MLVRANDSNNDLRVLESADIGPHIPWKLLRFINVPTSTSESVIYKRLMYTPNLDAIVQREKTHVCELHLNGEFYTNTEYAEEFECYNSEMIDDEIYRFKLPAFVVGIHVELTCAHPVDEVELQISVLGQEHTFAFCQECIHVKLDIEPDIPTMFSRVQVRIRGLCPSEFISNTFTLSTTGTVMVIKESVYRNIVSKWRSNGSELYKGFVKKRIPIKALTTTVHGPSY